MTTRAYLSIGEVLGLLVDEFPDVTISKIRFLETQGLVEPERTASGYRKFSDGHVERLRYVMREQKDNYLPLKVIKDRLEGDEGTPAALPRPLPTGAAWATIDTGALAAITSWQDEEHHGEHHPPAEGHGSMSADSPFGGGLPAEPVAVADVVTDVDEATPEPVVAEAVVAEAVPAAAIATVRQPLRTVSAPAPVSDDSWTADEVIAHTGASRKLLDELIAYGLIHPQQVAGTQTFDGTSCQIVGLAIEFASHGLEVRHMRTWRTNAEKETALFEQLILPLVRQRNPQARQQTVATLSALCDLGSELRTALMRSELKQYLD
jgi:DNA-binding transcriptional MerR regulator